MKDKFFIGVPVFFFLLTGFFLVLLLHANIEVLAQLGLVTIYFYFILILFGGSLAGFLFGILRSVGNYRGKQLNGKLELGGPIVGWLLVIGLGSSFQPSDATFPLTVFVHGEKGRQDLILRRAGSVLVDLGGDRRQEPIQANGQAFFPAVPARFRGQKVPIFLDAPGYEAIRSNDQYALADHVYLAVRHQTVHINGRVQDAVGQPVAQATVRCGSSATARTDADGLFRLDLPGALYQEQYTLSVSAEGFAPLPPVTAVPDSNALTITVRRP